MEEFDLPEEFGVSVSERERVEVSRAGAEKILDVLDETGVRATMFITCYLAERCPELIRRFRKSGHETASHGMNHSHFETADLERSREALERMSGEPVTGFRMARLAPVAKEEILAAGYHYESSMNPVWLPGRYCNLLKPLLPFPEACGLHQYPVSAVPGVRLPLFWLSFKNFPLSFYGLLAEYTAKRTGYFNLYSHPWEYNAESANSRWRIPGYITRHAGDDMADRLKVLIERLKGTGDFITFREAEEHWS